MKNNLGFPAYHGSPHDFDKFSLHKIGTGEGAQAYGYGLYFASAREVADYYRKSLLQEKVTAVRGIDPESYVGRRVFKFLNAQRHQHSAEALVAAAQSYAQAVQENARKQDAPGLAEMMQSTVDALNRLKPEDITLKKGQLFRVEVPEPDELLDWDATLGQQPLGVIKKLSDAGILPDGEEVVGWFREFRAAKDRSGPKWDLLIRKIRQFHEDGGKLPSGERYGGGMKGRDVYLAVVAGLGSPERASMALLKAGIPGLKYRDSESRDGEKVSYNFVIWDDSRVEVKEKFHGLGSAARWMRTPGGR